MENTRRSFFGALLAPFVAPLVSRLIPSEPDPLPLFDAIDALPKEVSFDEISAITLRELRSCAVMDNFFVQSPFLVLLNKRQKIEDAGGDIIGSFCRMPGDRWERLTGGIRWPERPPRLPA
jgi:hypothetical protein